MQVPVVSMLFSVFSTSGCLGAIFDNQHCFKGLDEPQPSEQLPNPDGSRIARFLPPLCIFGFDKRLRLGSWLTDGVRVIRPCLRPPPGRVTRGHRPATPFAAARNRPRRSRTKRPSASPAAYQSPPCCCEHRGPRP